MRVIWTSGFKLKQYRPRFSLRDAFNRVARACSLGGTPTMFQRVAARDLLREQLGARRVNDRAETAAVLIRSPFIRF